MAVNLSWHTQWALHEVDRSHGGWNRSREPREEGATEEQRKGPLSDRQRDLEMEALGSNPPLTPPTPPYLLPPAPSTAISISLK